MRGLICSWICRSGLRGCAGRWPARLSVPMDEVRMVTFVKPVATVYVGNPMIADITVIDSRHVFVLGKAFGATNIIALDSNGKRDRQQSADRLRPHVPTSSHSIAAISR